MHTRFFLLRQFAEMGATLNKKKGQKHENCVEQVAEEVAALQTSQ